MQTFTKPPSDAELETRCSAGKQNLWQVRLLDTPETLSARPTLGPPALFIFLCACLAVPTVGIMLVIASGLRSGVTRPAGYAGISIAGIGIAALAIPSTWAILFGLRRGASAQPQHFILDRARQTLELPALKITLPVKQINALVDLQTWEKIGGESQWVCELSVLVRCTPGTVSRYPVLRAQPVMLGRTAVKLAEALSVPCRVIRTKRRAKRFLGIVYGWESH